MKLHIVFDKLPGQEPARFVEIEDESGQSIRAGEWRARPDGLAELIISADRFYEPPLKEEATPFSVFIAMAKIGPESV